MADKRLVDAKTRLALHNEPSQSQTLQNRCSSCDSATRRIAELEAALRERDEFSNKRKAQKVCRSIRKIVGTRNGQPLSEAVADAVGALRSLYEAARGYMGEGSPDPRALAVALSRSQAVLTSSASQSPATEVANSNVKGDPNCAG